MDQAESILRQIKEIEHASITTDGDEIKEVHIVAQTARRPKQIVRDVESALNAVVRRRIDHRVISVVILDPSETPIDFRHEKPPPVAEIPKSQDRASPPTTVPAVSQPPVQRAEAHGDAGTAGERIRFISANLFVSGLRTQAQVELSWRGATRLGSATGASTRENAERLVATAAIHALQPFLGDQRALAFQEVAIMDLGRQEVVIVTAKLLEQRHEQTLTGSCTVEQDVQQSVVYAVLAAVNRILGGLAVREPVEYELRPAST